MADRTVYGRDYSENGWRMVDQGSCVWVAVPGTNVHLQIREGQPAIILGAFVADWNAYIEPVYEADSACWTATNSVASSNHLSGTACDVRWNSHPFRIENAGFNSAQLATMRELLKFYEGMVFWGNDWQSPKDAMHVQMGYDTYGSANGQRVQDFIRRKVRADGFSTFRRGDNPAPPPPVLVPPIQVPLSRAEGYALRIINEGRRRGVTPKGIQIALATGIVESNITVYANEKLPKSLALPHDAVGRDGLSVGIFQQQVKDSGNGWWWGDERTCMGVESSAGLFFDRLVKLPYNGDSKSPGAFAQQIQGSAFPARYDQHWGEAVALYNKLAGIPTTPTQASGDDMASVPQDQWDRVYRELTQRLASRSPLRHLDQTKYYQNGLVDTWAGLTANVDGMSHVGYVKLLASYKHPETIELLKELAEADPNQYPDRASDIDLANAILAEVYQPAPQNQVTWAGDPVPAAAAVAPSVVYRDVPAATITASNSTTGQIIGQAYDALEQLQDSGVLNNSGSAPLVSALISVLETKTAEGETA